MNRLHPCQSIHNGCGFQPAAGHQQPLQLLPRLQGPAQIYRQQNLDTELAALNQALATGLTSPQDQRFRIGLDSLTEMAGKAGLQLIEQLVSQRTRQGLAAIRQYALAPLG